MIFPVKRVKEELVKEFAASTMRIDDFAEAHSITPEALKSWIDEVKHPAPAAEGEFGVFSTTDFVEL